MGATARKIATDTDTAATPKPRKARKPAAERQGIKVIAAGEDFVCRDVVVDQAVLSKALGALRHVADSKSSIPVLGCVRIRPDQTFGTCGLTVTDLNLTLTVTIPATCRTGKPFAIQARRLLDVTRVLPAGPMAIDHADGSLAVLSAGRTKVTLEALHAQDFPKAPAGVFHNGDENAEIAWTESDATRISEMMARVEFSVCQDQTRFHLNGVLIESDGTTTRMVTTDGHRLTKISKALAFPTLPKGIIVPHHGAVEIRRMLDDGPCSIAWDGKYLHVRQNIGGYTSVLSVKPIDAQFPPYEQVIPKSFDSLVTVNRDDLIAALKRCKVATSDARGVAFAGSLGSLVVSAGNGDDIREMSETLDAECYAPVKVGVNPQYALEALARIDGERVVIAIKDPLDPIMLRSVDDATMRSIGDAEFVCVIMPMRVE